MTEQIRIVAISREHHPHGEEHCEVINRTAVFDGDTPVIEIIRWAKKCQNSFAGVRNISHLTINLDSSQENLILALEKEIRDEHYNNVGKNNIFSTGEENDLPF